MRDARRLTLTVLTGDYAIVRLDPGEDVPDAALAKPFSSITRTAGETSIVCPQEAVPAGALHEGGWRCLGVVDELDFSLAGVLASLAGPLAEAGVPIFVISTYDTDYLLVKGDRLARARDALAEVGHTVRD